MCGGLNSQASLSTCTCSVKLCVRARTVHCLCACTAQTRGLDYVQAPARWKVPCYFLQQSCPLSSAPTVDFVVLMAGLAGAVQPSAIVLDPAQLSAKITVPHCVLQASPASAAAL
jgi:hypothetical protein